MKKIMFFSVLLFSFLISRSQQTSNDPFPKKITVTGSAEMEITPDQIDVNIIIREYQKKGESKKELEGIKNEFLSACKAAGIADSNISIYAYTGYNGYFWLHKKKKKDPDLYASITYQVRFSSSKEMDNLVDRLDDEATQSFDIVNSSHSRITEFRRQLKIQAVKAAKEKANYLTEAIGEKLSSAITVKEPTERTIINTTGYFKSSNKVMESLGSTDMVTQADFKKIKLRFEVDVVFALL